MSAPALVPVLTATQRVGSATTSTATTVSTVAVMSTETVDLWKEDLYEEEFDEFVREDESLSLDESHSPRDTAADTDRYVTGSQRSPHINFHESATMDRFESDRSKSAPNSIVGSPMSIHQSNQKGKTFTSELELLSNLYHYPNQNSVHSQESQGNNNNNNLKLHNRSNRRQRPPSRYGNRENSVSVGFEMLRDDFAGIYNIASVYICIYLYRLVSDQCM